MYRAPFRVAPEPALSLAVVHASRFAPPVVMSPTYLELRKLTAPCIQGRHSMAYLDVAPMMVSLRTTPEEFEV
jgi:hypothetical protein